MKLCEHLAPLAKNLILINMGQEERDSWLCKICKKVFDPMECNVKYGDYPKKRGRPKKEKYIGASESMKKLIEIKNQIKINTPDIFKIYAGAVKISEWEKEYFDLLVEKYKEDNNVVL